MLLSTTLSSSTQSTSISLNIYYWPTNKTILCRHSPVRVRPLAVDLIYCHGCCLGWEVVCLLEWSSFAFASTAAPSHVLWFRQCLRRESISKIRIHRVYSCLPPPTNGRPDAAGQSDKQRFPSVGTVPAFSSAIYRVYCHFRQIRCSQKSSRPTFAIFFVVFNPMFSRCLSRCALFFLFNCMRRGLIFWCYFLRLLPAISGLEVRISSPIFLLRFAFLWWKN